ncbi:hypothetical protein H7K32_25490 [Brevibacillus agri]|uniref:Ig-like domain-containing protein n=1 Tax=Brevibacillus agri TaxID=51101 RepID=UPI001C8EAAF9|nr:Ig-like domain-containing protein [Brevibacillus agri]MBY0054918.1 hypothetical protein [Brevibacillus agri]
MTGKDIKPSNFKLVQKDNEYNEPYIDSIDVEGKVVTLTLGDSLTSGKTYVVSVTGLTQEPQTKEVTYTLAPASSVTVDTVRLPKIGTAQLKATVKDASGNDITGDYAVKWETNQSAGVVTEDGYIADVAKISGSVIAKAYVMNGSTKLYSSQVVLVAEDMKATTYEGFTIDKDGEVLDYSKVGTDLKTSLKMGESGFLFPFVKDQFGQQFGTNVKNDGKFKFTSKTPTIVVVNSETGELTPVATGNAVVQVEAGDFKKLISFEVKAASKATSLVADTTALTLSDKAPAKAVKVTVKDQYNEALANADVAIVVDEADGKDYLDAVDSKGDALSTVKTDDKGEAVFYVKPKLAGTEEIKLSVGSGTSKVETTVNVTVTASSTTTSNYIVVNKAVDNKLDLNATAKDGSLTLELYPIDANGNINGTAQAAVWTVKDYSNGIVTISDDTTTKDGVTDKAVDAVTVTAAGKGTATVTAKVGSLEVGTFNVEVIDSRAVIGSVALTKNTLTSKQSNKNLLDDVLANITAKTTTGAAYDKDGDGTFDAAKDHLDAAEVKSIYSSNLKVVEGDTDVDGKGRDALTIKGAGETTLTITFEDSLNLNPVSVKVVVSDDVAPDKPTVAKVTEGDTEVTGTAEAGSTVTVTGEDGTVLGTATADADGKFSVTITAAVKDAKLSVTATDAAKNTSDVTTVTVQPKVVS